MVLAGEDKSMTKIRAGLARLWALARREPALLLQLAGALVAILGATVVHLTTDQMGALTGLAAAVVGILTWRAAGDSLSALILGLLKASLVTALAWHLNISPEDQALIYTAAAGILGAWLRTQVTAPASAIDGEVVSASPGLDPGVPASTSPAPASTG